MPEHQAQYYFRQLMAAVVSEAKYTRFCLSCDNIKNWLSTPAQNMLREEDVERERRALWYNQDACHNLL